jgi:hypothetical protein
VQLLVAPVALRCTDGDVPVARDAGPIRDDGDTPVARDAGLTRGDGDVPVARDAGPTRGDGDVPDATRGEQETSDPCGTEFLLPRAPPAPPLRGSFDRDAALDAILRVALEQPYSGRPTSVSATLLADLNGDGRTDLLLNDQRDAAGGQQPPPAVQSRVWVSLQRDDGTLGPPTRIEGAYRCHLAADLDHDARLDLVCGLDGGGSAVLWGAPAGHAVTNASALPGGPTSIAVAAWDLDDDGALDLVFSVFGSRSRVFRAQGERRYEDVTERWGVDVSGATFQAAFVDLDGDGRHDLYFSDDGDRHQNRALRAVRGDSDVEPRFERFAPTAPMCDPAGFFGTSNAGAMGVALADLNRDGAPEMLLATGPDLPVLTRRRAAPFHWIDVQDRLTLDRETTTSGSFLVPWSPVFWDMDHDGFTDLWLATGDDEGFSMMPDRGQSRLLIYRGAADARFTEVGDTVRVGLTGQFAHVQLGDLDHDGDLDVVIGRRPGEPVALRNNLTPAGRHVLLDLRGTVSNPHGLGATVRVGESPQVFPVGDRWTSWGTAQPVLDLTLPGEPAGDVLRVRWPSGAEQTVRQPITAPRITLTEPRWLTLSPEGEVRVDLAALGARPEATVTVDATDPAFPWISAAVRGDDGVWTRRFSPPGRAGAAALRVRVDGRPLPARPRL